MNRQMRIFVCVTSHVSHWIDLSRADIAAYEKVHEQILHMADMLSAGIVKQHSAKFK